MQEILVVLVVLAAGGYLLWFFGRGIRKKTPTNFYCTCFHCPVVIDCAHRPGSSSPSAAHESELPLSCPNRSSASSACPPPLTPLQ